jgi:hypothetical protein
MPKYGIHHIVIDRAMGNLLASPRNSDQAAANALFNHYDMASLGAIGPDLFFWAPDYEVVDKFYKLYQNIESVVNLYNEIVQPIRDIRDAVVEPVEDAVETLAPNTIALIRQTIEEMQETADLFKSAIGTGIFAGVISGVNLVSDMAGLPHASTQLFNLFIPPVQYNKPEPDWYWFDMLHYRKTGTFATMLASLAQNDHQRAYAYGYYSHIATDVTGHPFVNQIVGGPYRLHPQRHATVENYMDAWAFHNHFNQNVNHTLNDRMGLPENLPADIGDLLHAAMQQTFATSPRPDFLSRDDIDTTYEVFYKVLSMLHNMIIPRPEEPFSGVAEILNDALNDLLEPPPNPPNSPSGSCSLGDIFSIGFTQSSRDCYKEFFEELEDWMEYLGELVLWTLETIADLFDLLLTLLLSLPITVLLAILYGLQLLLYQLYQTVREALALEGFLTPDPSMLNNSHGRNLTTMSLCAAQPFKYPMWAISSGSHLVCPGTAVEQPATAPDFFSISNTVTPNQFIRDLPFDYRWLRDYASRETPDQTRSLERDRRRIGNASDFTAWLIGTAADGGASGNDLAILRTGWNLDADRGYGYKAWNGEIPDQGGDSVENENYVV